jgi:hypothetical protein
MDDRKIAFQGEMMLLQWAESSTRGRTVTFLLDETGEQHPFREFSIKSGKRAGQRFMAVLVELDENDQPVEQQMKLSQQAFIFCNDPQFWEWANERTFDNIDNADAARAFILNLLRITSRSQIDSDPEVADGFKRLILQPFNAYRKVELKI